MEKIGSILEMSEAKQKSLEKAYESLHAEASSLLRFNLEWRELEAQFDSIRNSLRRRFRELQALEDATDRREKSLESAKFNFDAEMAGRVQELHRVEKLVESGNQRLNSIKSLIQEHDLQLSDKERRFKELGKSIRESERKWKKKLKSIEKIRVDENKDNEGKNRVVKKQMSKDSSIIESLIWEDMKCKEADEATVKRVLGKLNDAVWEKKRELSSIEMDIQERTMALNSVVKSLEEKEELLKEKEKLLKELEQQVEVTVSEINEKLRHIDSQDTEICENALRIREAERVIKEKESSLKQLSRDQEEVEHHSKRMSERFKIEGMELFDRERALEAREKKIVSRERELELAKKEF